MEYIQIKNLEKYHPGYRDRNLVWCKVYFRMINSDPEFEMMHETDKWRFIALIMLELQNKKPIPLDKNYLSRKGFDFGSRSMSLTLKMLHNFVDVVTEAENTCGLEKEKEEDKDNTSAKRPTFDHRKHFSDIWGKYPKKDGKKSAERVFKATVKSDEDLARINRALSIYLQSDTVKKGFIKNGSTWFNNWQDWESNPVSTPSASTSQDKFKCLACDKLFSRNEYAKHKDPCEAKFKKDNQYKPEQMKKILKTAMGGK